MRMHKVIDEFCSWTSSERRVFLKELYPYLTSHEKLLLDMLRLADCQFDKLPGSVLDIIIKHLDPPSILNLCQTSKAIYLSIRDSAIWGRALRELADKQVVNAAQVSGLDLMDIYGDVATYFRNVNGMCRSASPILNSGKVLAVHLDSSEVNFISGDGVNWQVKCLVKRHESDSESDEAAQLLKMYLNYKRTFLYKYIGNAWVVCMHQSVRVEPIQDLCGQHIVESRLQHLGYIVGVDYCRRRQVLVTVCQAGSLAVFHQSAGYLERRSWSRVATDLEFRSLAILPQMAGLPEEKLAVLLWCHDQVFVTIVTNTGGVEWSTEQHRVFQPVCSVDLFQVKVHPSKSEMLILWRRTDTGETDRSTCVFSYSACVEDETDNRQVWKLREGGCVVISGHVYEGRLGLPAKYESVEIVDFGHKLAILGEKLHAAKWCCREMCCDHTRDRLALYNLQTGCWLQTLITLSFNDPPPRSMQWEAGSHRKFMVARLAPGCLDGVTDWENPLGHPVLVWASDTTSDSTLFVCDTARGVKQHLKVEKRVKKMLKV